MFTKTSKDSKRSLVHERIRRRLRGTSERPRLAVYRSVSHIYAQVIDDSKGVTLVAASSNEGTETKRGRAAMWRRPKKSANAWPSALKNRVSRVLCSTAAAIFITAG